MFDRLRALIFRWLKLPPQPEPPLGAPGSVRVFRAGYNFYRFRVALWAFAQVGAVAGAVVSLVFVSAFADRIREAHQQRMETQAAAAAAGVVEEKPVEAVPEEPKRRLSREERAAAKRAKFERDAQEFAQRAPLWVADLLMVLEAVAMVFLVVQAVVTYAARRLDWEQRWYIVTDRSLRVRSGITSLSEATMSFANLQQVEVVQGPVQRLLGIATVRVQSAGGGGVVKQDGGKQQSLHLVEFEGVDNAVEVRDLILERLKVYRDTGLGDPSEVKSPAQAPALQSAPLSSTLTAAREVLREARALRSALQAP